MRSKLFGLLVLLLGSVTLCAQPASSTSDEQRLNTAARDLIRSQVRPEMLEELYTEGAGSASLHFQAALQPSLKRALSEDEKQRLYLFWYRKIKELLPYSTIQDLLSPVVAKHLTLAEMEQINEFYQTPVGRKLTDLAPALTREGRAAGEGLGRKMADKEWIENTTAELKRDLPSLFPEDSPDK